MEAYQERIVTERDELQNKKIKLQQFIDTDVFNKLELQERKLLENQLFYMRGYLDVLNQRIVRF